MANNKKISQLGLAGGLTGTELVPVVQGGVTVQTTTQDIADLGGASSTQLISPDGNTSVTVIDGQSTIESTDGAFTTTITQTPASIIIQTIDLTTGDTNQISLDQANAKIESFLPLELIAPNITKNSVEVATVDIIATATSQTAVNDGDYIVNATTTFTDPTPVEAKGFTVIVRNGTATVGGTAYSVAGTIIKRIYQGAAWANYVYSTSYKHELLYITTGNQTTTSTTPATITGLTTSTVPANTRVFITGRIRIACGGTGGVKFQVNTPTGATGLITLTGNSTTNNASYRYDATLVNSLTGAFCAFIGGTSVDILIDVTTSSTAGAISLLGASNTGGQLSTFVQDGTKLTYEQG